MNLVFYNLNNAKLLVYIKEMKWEQIKKWKLIYRMYRPIPQL
jgi:hypothetical protein